MHACARHGHRSNTSSPIDPPNGLLMYIHREKREREREGEREREKRERGREREGGREKVAYWYFFIPSSSNNTQNCLPYLFKFIGIPSVATTHTIAFQGNSAYIFAYVNICGGGVHTHSTHIHRQTNARVHTYTYTRTQKLIHSRIYSTSVLIAYTHAYA